MSVRFPKLTPETMNAEQNAVAAEIAAGPRGEVRGPFLPLLHNPALARRIQQLGEQLRWGGKLPAHLLELAVLVTARRWTCQHEWYMHEKLARTANLDSEIIDALARGHRPDSMPPDETLVYSFCLQVHGNGRVDDATFAAARLRFGLEGVLELLALNGYYSMMAMVLNTASMPLPDNAPPPLGPLGKQ